jgi:hypothetical protein
VLRELQSGGADYSTGIDDDNDNVDRPILR